MYEAFYGFKEKPFSMLPDPGFLYLSKKHRAALTLLEYGLLNHVGFCVISGEPGAGKTTILRAMLERISDDITVGLITNTHQSFGGLLDWILSAFNLHRPQLSPVEMHQVFMEFLIGEYAKGRTVLLIVDEAQNIKPDALEELRMLTNVNTEKDQLMQVVLAGQPALKDTLRLPDLMQFAQRIAVDYHLEPLSLEETCGYIQHRLVTAGAEKDVFTPAACERIYNYSGGTPRLINLLCETVLVYGFADQQEMIDVGLVDEMVLERMKDSVVPIVNREIANQDNTLASKALEENFPWIRPPGDTAKSKPEAAPETAEVSTILTASAEEDRIIEDQVKPDISAVAEGKKKAIRANNQSEDTKDIMAPEDQTRAKSSVERATANPATAKADHSAKASTRNAQTGPAPASPAPSKKKPDISELQTGDNKTRKQLIKYGVVAVMVAVVMIVFVLALKRYEQIEEASKVDDATVEEMRQRELEEKKLRQLQIETETLKKERDAAIAKAEAEKLAKLEAAKRAAAEADIAAKEAVEKIRLEEKKRVEAAKKREREAKKAEARAREAAKRAQLEAAKLEEQRRVMQIRLEKEKRLKELEEARRAELERQRQQMLAAEESAQQAAEESAKQAAEEAALKAEAEVRAKSAACSGPTARFKSACR
jgi:type II secretory pathway predicted ATPase ExeA